MSCQSSIWLQLTLNCFGSAKGIEIKELYMQHICFYVFLLLLPLLYSQSLLTHTCAFVREPGFKDQLAVLHARFKGVFHGIIPIHQIYLLTLLRLEWQHSYYVGSEKTEQDPAIIFIAILLKRKILFRKMRHTPDGLLQAKIHEYPWRYQADYVPNVFRKTIIVFLICNCCRSEEKFLRPKCWKGYQRPQFHSHALQGHSMISKEGCHKF